MSGNDKYLTFSKFVNSLNVRSPVKLRREHYCPQTGTVLLKWTPFHLEKYPKQYIFLPKADSWLDKDLFLLMGQLFQKLRKISQKIIFPESLQLRRPLPSVQRKSWTMRSSSRPMPRQTYFPCCHLKATRVALEGALSKVTDWTEGGELKDSDISPKPAGTSIKTLTGKVEKTVSNHRNVNKPVGGLNVAEVFIKKEQKDLKCADVDDDDWDTSSLEEEKSLGRRIGREQKEPPPVKNESNST
ncbi:zinc finger protein [Pontoporia blainvillei]|uniref:Zinc finger protein n=1 Tax=Pontoporia blainvillei TaxID=48723 RepID=A0ABX0S2Q1_PONBL|nr:zinc finger protein [Pontoporia blainvillei]